MLAQVQCDLGEGGFASAPEPLWMPTIIHAPSSTQKPRAECADAEMPQTKKGKPWYFGMKAPVGVDK